MWRCKTGSGCKWAGLASLKWVQIHVSALSLRAVHSRRRRWTHKNSSCLVWSVDDIKKLHNEICKWSYWNVCVLFLKNSKTYLQKIKLKTVTKELIVSWILVVFKTRGWSKKKKKSLQNYWNLCESISSELLRQNGGRTVNGDLGDDFAFTHSLVRKCLALLWPASLGPRLQSVQRWPQAWGTQLREKAKGTSWMLFFHNFIVCFFVSRAPLLRTGWTWQFNNTHRSSNHCCTAGSNLPSAQLFRRRGTWSGPAALTDPPCSSAGSSWSFATLWTSRSRLGLRRGSWGGCTARWTAARLWTEDSTSRGHK